MGFNHYGMFVTFQYNELHHMNEYCTLSYDVVPESEITLCNKIDKPLVAYRYPGKVMTSITMLGK